MKILICLNDTLRGVEIGVTNQIQFCVFPSPFHCALAQIHTPLPPEMSEGH